jgi:hypothetical protein
MEMILHELRGMSVDELSHLRRHISRLITSTRAAAVAASFPVITVEYLAGPRGDWEEVTVTGQVIRLSGTNIILVDRQQKQTHYITFSRILEIDGQPIPRDEQITPAHFGIV